jgi:hypothetical protein
MVSRVRAGRAPRGHAATRSERDELRVLRPSIAAAGHPRLLHQQPQLPRRPAPWRAGPQRDGRCYSNRIPPRGNYTLEPVATVSQPSESYFENQNIDLTLPQ